MPPTAKKNPANDLTPEPADAAHETLAHAFDELRALLNAELPEGGPKYQCLAWVDGTQNWALQALDQAS